MGLSDLFIDPDTLPEGTYGFIQLMFLLVVYAYILCTGSNYISDGSELLLLIPSVAGIVGSVILPVLGAVPDGAIVLFSGMGPDAQEQLSVGVGALAGSTIMLLTLPWFLAVIAGRVSILDGGELSYTKKPKLQKNRSGLFNSAVACADELSKGGALMLITSISYLVIQIPALSFEGESDEEIGQDESTYALVGLVMTGVFFFGYLWYQWALANGGDEAAHLKQQKILKSQMECGMVGVVDAFRPDFAPLAAQMASSYKQRFGESYSERSKRVMAGGKRSLLGGSPGKQYEAVGSDGDIPEAVRAKFMQFIRPFFDKYDADHSGAIEMEEIRLVFKDLNEKMSKPQFEGLFKVFDLNNDGKISFDEFVSGTSQYIVSKILEEESAAKNKLAGDEEEPKEAEEDEEHEEMPEEFLDLPPAQRSRAIVGRSCYMMFLGTFIVLLFSDPMVDVLTAVGDRTGVPSFYVAFVLAPLASNASELIAAYNYAAKKTSSTILVSLSALQGAACMNNTFCLAVFFALIYFKTLAWEFAAETLAIIAVQIVIALFSLKNKQTLFDGALVMCLYPISLILVATLEGMGWD
ncbi:unnamed protein product [Heterosigma akashiwo]